MGYDKDHEDEDGEMSEHSHWHHMAGPMKKEFKLAMLEKKEKILQAKLDFLGKIKELIKKAPESKK